MCSPIPACVAPTALPCAPADRFIRVPPGVSRGPEQRLAAAAAAGRLGRAMGEPPV